MVKCANCGTELEEGQKFCFECGTPVPQTKKCVKCGIDLPLKMKFCPECGANQNGTTAAGGDGSFNLGDKNVIAGDVIGHKEETHVAGNATFIKNEDQTKQVKKCHICGSLVKIVQGFDCLECHQFTCENCFNVHENSCNNCVEQKKESKLNRYKDALKMVLADGRIEASERRELINLQQQLGISNEIAKQLEDELKSLSTSNEFTTFEKLNLDKAEDLFYKQRNVDEALNLIEPIVTAHPDDEKVLSLYLPILAEKNPEKALQKIDSLQYDILMAFITKVSIYLKKKNMNEAEISLNQAIRIWHENTLVKCYQVLLNYAFYKQSDEFTFMEKACNIASNLGNAENPLELSHQVKVQSILQAEAGEQEVDFDEDFCEQNGLLFWIMINNPIYTMEENKRKNLEKKLKNELSKSKSFKVDTSTWTLEEYIGYDTNVTIPYGIKSIGKNAFYNCESLRSIEIPDTITSIGDFAFYGCASISEIVIPNSVTSIGDSAFSFCKSLKIINIPYGVTLIEADTFSECISLSEIDIPDSVTSIGGSAFEGCTSLSAIEIPDNVTYIGSSAFYGCSSLSGIKIPYGVTSIGSNTFSGCTFLSKIDIPDSVTSIGGSAFCGCTSLSAIEIPDTVTSIENGAFMDCSSLTKIDIPISVKKIEWRTFDGCTSVKSVVLHGIEEIGDRAFWNCTSLISVKLPACLAVVNEAAFWGCRKLDSVTKNKLSEFNCEFD